MANGDGITDVVDLSGNGKGAALNVYPTNLSNDYGSSDWINVRDFGVVGDFVTDDLPAFQAAIDTIYNTDLGPFPGTGRLIVPAGRYYLSDTPYTPECIQIHGAGSAQTGGAGTLIRVPNNKDGFNLEGAGSFLGGVQLWGGNVQVNDAGIVTTYAGGDSPTGYGVKISNDFVKVSDVQSVLFGSGGFLANADGAAQANSSFLERCQALYNGGHGFEISGTDANAGITVCCSAIENAGCGFLDFSFLGNGHYSNHTRGNGMVDPTGCNNPTGACKHNGAGWYVVIGREIQASTEVPGSVTDSTAAWRPFYTGPYDSFKVWASGMTWIAGSSYATNPSNANSYNCLFSNPYAEQSQPPAQISYPAQIHGGLIADGNAGSAPTLFSNGDGFAAKGLQTVADASGRYSYIGAPNSVAPSDTAFGWQQEGGIPWRMSSNGAMWRNGGAIWQTTASGINMSSGMGIYNDGNKVLGARGAAVADAVDATSVITQFNLLLARLRASTGHGIIA